MFEVASQIIICLILAALIGGIIGYLIGRASCSERSACNEGEKGSHELHIDQQENNTTEVVSLLDTKDVGEKPTLLTEPRKGGKDNLHSSMNNNLSKFRGFEACIDRCCYSANFCCTENNSNGINTLLEKVSNAVPRFNAKS